MVRRSHLRAVDRRCRLWDGVGVGGVMTTEQLAAKIKRLQKQNAEKDKIISDLRSQLETSWRR